MANSRGMRGCPVPTHPETERESSWAAGSGELSSSECPAGTPTHVEIRRSQARESHRGAGNSPGVGRRSRARETQRWRPRPPRLISQTSSFQKIFKNI